jgi:putative PIN family toxin of toxin-antitoxin system
LHIATSEPLIDELLRTLATPYFRARVSPVDAAETVALLLQSAVTLTRTVQGVATHPEDDVVVATALSAQADVIVTGDQKLLNRVRQFEGVRFLSPREFLNLLADSE